MNDEPTMFQIGLAEAAGAFALVFAGCGAAMANTMTGGAVTHVGVALAFGATIAAMIFAYGHVSGGHFNPAVTLVFLTAGAIKPKAVPVYIGSQVVGATGAAAVLYLLFGNVASLGATVPNTEILTSNPAVAAGLIEVVLTAFLMIVILQTALDKRAPSGFAGLAIGLTILLCALSMGPVTGGSMNPARTLGPALVSGEFTALLAYIIGPIVGAQVAVLLHKLLGPRSLAKPRPLREPEAHVAATNDEPARV